MTWLLGQFWSSLAQIMSWAGRAECFLCLRESWSTFRLLWL